MNMGLMTSKTYEYETPQEFFNELDREFDFGVDVCATEKNSKMEPYFTKEDDGLKQDWTAFHAVWMNPPYGREISKWVEKAYNTSQSKHDKFGTTVVCLLPAITDTAWWHDYCMKGEIRFIRGRLKFGDCKHNAPFPCAVVIFRNQGGVVK